LCRASTSFFARVEKTWMAGTSPAMTQELTPDHPNILQVCT
jgi:hypothetical protein